MVTVAELIKAEESRVKEHKATHTFERPSKIRSRSRSNNSNSSSASVNMAGEVVESPQSPNGTGNANANAETFPKKHARENGSSKEAKTSAKKNAKKKGRKKVNRKHIYRTSNGPKSANPGSGFSFCDHYSTGASTDLRFRGKAQGRKQLHIIDDVGRDQQLLLLVDKPGKKAGSKQLQVQARVQFTGTFGTGLLKTVCTLVSFFVMTALCAFSIQCLLFLFMNVVATYTPSTWTADPPVWNIVGCILACPLLLVSLGSLMAMSWACTVDCWRGLGSHHASLLKATQFWPSHNRGQQKAQFSPSRNGNGEKKATWRSPEADRRQWLVLVVFLGIPLLVLGITALVDRSRDDFDGYDWWGMTLQSWAGSAFVFQILYIELCVWNELTVCYRMLQVYGADVSGASENRDSYPEFLGLIAQNIVLTQRQKYSAVRRKRYLLEGGYGPERFYANSTSFSDDATKAPAQIHCSLRTGLLLLCGGGWFYDLLRDDRTLLEDGTVIPSKRNYTIPEVFGSVQIYTKSNWSLARLWCLNPRKATSLFVVKGEGSVEKFQVNTAYICYALFMFLTLLVIGAVSTWLENPAGQTAVIVLLVLLICFVPMIRSACKIRQYEMNQRMNDGNGDGHDEERKYHGENEDGDEGCSETFVSVWETVRVSELKVWACYATAGMEIILFFLWPLISMFVFENTPLAVIFLVFGLHTIPRHYFNVSNLLQELGSLDKLDLGGVDLALLSCGQHDSSDSDSDNDNDSEEAENRVAGKFREKRDVKNKLLISNLVRRVTRSRANRNWIGLFFFYFLVFFSGYYLSVSEEMFSYEMGRYKWKNVVYANDFSWDPQPNLPYPTCEVKKGFTFPGEEGTASLANYAFLSTLAFSSAEEAQPLLDQWFGNGTVLDDTDYVEAYRQATGTEDHPVTYKLFVFPSDPTAGIVGIRGSEMMWDWMVDMQLWSGGIFAQAILSINPLGNIWEPIMDKLVYLINYPQSEKLKEVSYYRYTSEFVEALYSGYGGRQYESLRVTGASLGGGLAILTGAITGASAIAFSGLNAMYSRRTFLPPITEEQLNTRVFNTIPERDIIAHIDKPGMNYQRMQCNAPKNSLFGCHSMFRSLCEIQFQCGSQGRPINCWCVSNYGYPVPTQLGDKTWEETCARSSPPPS